MPSRTAPTVDFTAPSYVNLTIHVIDNSGDLYSETFRVANAATDTQIEAMVAAYQAAINGSIWKVSYTDVWTGAAVATNADPTTYQSVSDGINFTFRTSSFTADTLRLVTPLGSELVANTDTPDMANSTLLQAVRDAYLVVGPAGNTFEQASFSERRKTGKR